jgi:hypothetical protein
MKNKPDRSPIKNFKLLYHMNPNKGTRISQEKFSDCPLKSCDASLLYATSKYCKLGLYTLSGPEWNQRQYSNWIFRAHFFSPPGPHNKKDLFPPALYRRCLPLRLTFTYSTYKNEDVGLFKELILEHSYISIYMD